MSQDKHHLVCKRPDGFKREWHNLSLDEAEGIMRDLSLQNVGWTCWTEAEPSARSGLPPACLIAFLFGTSALSRMLPYLRMFRDRVLPSPVTVAYYVLSGFALKWRVKA